MINASALATHTNLGLQWTGFDRRRPRRSKPVNKNIAGAPFEDPLGRFIEEEEEEEEAEAEAEGKAHYIKYLHAWMSAHGKEFAFEGIPRCAKK